MYRKEKKKGWNNAAIILLRWKRRRRCCCRDTAHNAHERLLNREIFETSSRSPSLYAYAMQFFYIPSRMPYLKKKENQYRAKNNSPLISIEIGGKERKSI